MLYYDVFSISTAIALFPFSTVKSNQSSYSLNSFCFLSTLVCQAVGGLSMTTALTLSGACIAAYNAVCTFSNKFNPT